MTKTKKSVKEIQVANRSIDEKLNECDSAYTSGSFKYLRLLVHIIGAAQFIYALYYWDSYITFPNTDGSGIQGSKLKFLTFLNLALQAFYHPIALLNDLFGSNAIHPHPVPFLRRLRDFIFTSFAFPIGHNVCLSFWVIYAFDRELIFPRALEPYFPGWLNHVVHTNVGMLMIMDLFTCFRNYPKGKSGVIITSIVMFLYICLLHIIYYLNGRWVYPMFDMLNMPMRYFMLFGIALVSVFFYFVGEFVNNTIWAPELKLLQQKMKVKQR